MRDGPESAGDHLNVDPALRKLRQKHLQLTIANQGIAADNREM